MTIGSGTQVKIQVSNLPIGDLTMDDYYFELEARLALLESQNK